MTESITHSRYEQLHYLGAAGPVADLDTDTTHRWQQQHPEWKGRYWQYLPIEDSELLRIEPVNVTARSKDPR